MKLGASRPGLQRPGFTPITPPKRTPPQRVVTLPPSAFAETYNKRPAEPIAIGIRLVGEETTSGAMSLAVEDANRDAGEGIVESIWIELYNTNVMIHVLAQACCKHDDVNALFFEKAPNDMLRMAFRPATIQRLWEEYQALSKSTSPLTIEATDEDLLALGEMLQIQQLLEGVETFQARRLRRLATMLRDELLALPERAISP